ncbi:GntR family transcriptional regulator [Ruania alkalisoli]|uniref:GntR family transcriptional regulator n=1 Tax=Ruania alkalisoli TaxID=2779775 RepID=A0A7M1SQR4_9MICO|nr:GntR family transcriptional regulator [Ruania alkalisoli]QOR69919.1 GntR family transcriptional regulator [Ruania alkalisoli]
MQVRIDDGDPTPPYEQLRRQLLALVHAGGLPAGARLPPIRQLAADLGVAAGTVARAYRELEDAGWLVSRRGGGTRVAEGAVAPQVPPAVLTLAEELVQRARELGADSAAVRAAIDRALARPEP